MTDGGGLMLYHSRIRKNVTDRENFNYRGQYNPVDHRVERANQTNISNNNNDHFNNKNYNDSNDNFDNYITM